MDIKSYFQPLLKWWWMLVAACLLASVSSYMIVRRQPPIYRSHTSLMIGQSINNPNPAQTQFYLEQQLAQIYAGIGMREPVREATMKALGLSWLPEYQFVAIPNSQLIEIFVTDTNPARAQAVAAELAHQLILRSPTVGQTENSSRQEFVDDRLDNLQNQIKSTQSEIDKLRQDMGNLNSARQIADKEREIAALENKLNVLEVNYATLLGNSNQGAPNSLTIVEPAELPTVPVGPNRILSVVMSVVISLALATIGAYALEFFDPNFRSLAEITKALPYSVLGQIAEIPKGSKPFMYVAEAPLSPISDAFRMVKNAMETAGVGEIARSVQILSSESGDGKSTISVNLAVTFAKGGKQVILVDADLRKALLTKTFGLTNEHGFSDVLMGKVGVNHGLQLTGIDNLAVLPAGAMIEDPGFLFDSNNLVNVIMQLESMADIVIYDSPPAFISDSMALLRRINNVVYIVCMGRSKKDTAKHFREHSKMANARVIGMVLNRMPLGSTYYGKYYGKYASYYDMSKKKRATPDESQEQSIESPSWIQSGRTQAEKTLYNRSNGKESPTPIELPKVKVDKKE